VRAAFGATFGRALEGVRATVFPRRILLWNRTAADRTIGGIVAVPAGGLAAVARGGAAETRDGAEDTREGATDRHVHRRSAT
jgi:hypothetical protein